MIDGAQIEEKIDEERPNAKFTESVCEALRVTIFIILKHREAKRIHEAHAMI